jgi:hypothetical protein
MSVHNKQSAGQRHQMIWELLPWYVNDTLNEPERNRMVHHIAECQLCEEEIGRCRTIAAAIRATDPATWSPSPDRVARMMARIDGKSGAPSRGIGFREWFEKILVVFQETPSFFRWALAAETAMIVLLVGAIVLQTPVTPSLDYRTLSDPEGGAQPGIARIQVVFADDTTVGEIRTLLTVLNAAIVAGPSPMAVYSIAISGSGRDALERLRAHPKVRLAELKQQ